jgi:similar to stage IV sporulation protein
LVVIKTAQSGESADVAKALPPSDITADKDCVITEIIALKGMPQVKAGDSVQKGDILVSGTLVPVGFEENREPSYTACEAKIRGKCVENKKITVPLQYTEKKYTEKKYSKNAVIFFNKKFNTIFSKNEPKYKKYDIMEEIRQLKMDEEHPLPVFICKNIYKEYIEVKRTLTEEEAKNKAASELIDYIVESYPLSSDIISTKLDFEIEKDSVVLNAEIISERDIGMSTPLTPQEERDVNGTAENTNSQ